MDIRMIGSFIQHSAAIIEVDLNYSWFRKAVYQL
jgi:hypothetical protein